MTVFNSFHLYHMEYYVKAYIPDVHQWIITTQDIIIPDHTDEATRLARHVPVSRTIPAGTPVMTSGRMQASPNRLHLDIEILTDAKETYGTMVHTTSLRPVTFAEFRLLADGNLVFHTDVRLFTARVKFLEVTGRHSAWGAEQGFNMPAALCTTAAQLYHHRAPPIPPGTRIALTRIVELVSLFAPDVEQRSQHRSLPVNTVGTVVASFATPVEHAKWRTGEYEARTPTRACTDTCVIVRWDGLHGKLQHLDYVEVADVRVVEAIDPMAIDTAGTLEGVGNSLAHLSASAREPKVDAALPDLCSLNVPPTSQLARETSLYSVNTERLRHITLYVRGQYYDPPYIPVVPDLRVDLHALLHVLMCIGQNFAHSATKFTDADHIELLLAPDVQRPAGDHISNEWKFEPGTKVILCGLGDQWWIDWQTKLMAQEQVELVITSKEFAWCQVPISAQYLQIPFISGPPTVECRLPFPLFIDLDICDDWSQRTKEPSYMVPASIENQNMQTLVRFHASLTEEHFHLPVAPVPTGDVLQADEAEIAERMAALERDFVQDSKDKEVETDDVSLFELARRRIILDAQHKAAQQIAYTDTWSTWAHLQISDPSWDALNPAERRARVDLMATTLPPKGAGFTPHLRPPLPQLYDMEPCTPTLYPGWKLSATFDNWVTYCRRAEQFMLGNYKIKDITRYFQIQSDMVANLVRSNEPSGVLETEFERTVWTEVAELVALCM